MISLPSDYFESLLYEKLQMATEYGYLNRNFQASQSAVHAHNIHQFSLCSAGESSLTPLLMYVLSILFSLFAYRCLVSPTLGLKGREGCSPGNKARVAD